MVIKRDIDIADSLAILDANRIFAQMEKNRRCPGPWPVFMANFNCLNSGCLRAIRNPQLDCEILFCFSLPPNVISFFDFTTMPASPSSWILRDGQDSAKTYRAWSWEAGFHVEKFQPRTGTWKICNNDLEELTTSLRFVPGNVIALIRISESVPKEIISRIRNITFVRMAILTIARKAPGILDIVRDNPVLAIFVADACARNRISFSETCRLVQEKRRIILERLGFEDSSKGTLALMTKIVCKEFDRETFKILEDVFCSPQAIMILKGYTLSKIPINLVRLVAEDPFLCSCEFMRSHIAKLFSAKMENPEVEDLFDPNLRRIYEDARRMGSYRISNYKEMLKACKSVNALRRLHDGWAHDLGRPPMEVLFPEPPIKGISEIVPIISNLQLYDEGHEMRHCVFSYAEYIMDGEFYVYKVLEPERATLGLEIGKNGSLKLTELVSRRNAKVSQQTKEIVLAWMGTAKKEN